MEKKDKLELFLENILVLKPEFVFGSYNQTKRLIALMSTFRDKRVDVLKLKESVGIIKANTKWSSVFRGHTLLIIASLLSYEEDPKYVFNKVLKVFDLLKELNFASSWSLALSAINIVRSADEIEYKLIISKMKFIYDNIKKNHRFLFGRNDYYLCSILALSEVSGEFIVKRYYSLYEKLNKSFYNKSGVIALSCILSLKEDITNADKIVLDYKDEFLNKSLKLHRSFSFLSYASLTLLNESPSESFKGINPIYDRLRSATEIGKFTVSKEEVLIFSIALYTYEKIKEVSLEINVMNPLSFVENIIIFEINKLVITLQSQSSL